MVLECSLSKFKLEGAIAVTKSSSWETGGLDWQKTITKSNKENHEALCDKYDSSVQCYSLAARWLRSSHAERELELNVSQQFTLVMEGQIVCWGCSWMRNIDLLCRSCAFVLCLLLVRLCLEYFMKFWATLLSWGENSRAYNWRLVNRTWHRKGWGNFNPAKMNWKWSKEITEG